MIPSSPPSPGGRGRKSSKDLPKEINSKFSLELEGHQISLAQLYERLYAAYGPQHWWPAETPFEMMIGAILTQNTAWTNVEKALDNLKNNASLDPGIIAALPEAALARLLKPSGYFNIKARRLQNYCRWFNAEGGYAALVGYPTSILREKLLAVSGIGPETADAMLLYAFYRPVFVIDAYTRRILLRLGMITGKPDYEELRRLFETNVTADTALYNEYHALIVQHAKVSCISRPACRQCCLQAYCHFVQ